MISGHDSISLLHIQAYNLGIEEVSVLYIIWGNLPCTYILFPVAFIHVHARYDTQNLEWLESECDGFLIGHSQFGDCCAQATKLKDKHDRFVERIEPTCAKTEKVVESLEKLRPQAPPLASSIDQLCQAVSERIKGRKALIRRRSSVLNMFVEFCSVYKQVSTSARIETKKDSL